MEIKRLVSKYVYHIEPKPGGGFIAKAGDPAVPNLEAPTRMELQHKIQDTVLAGLRSDFPGLHLPSQSSEMKFSFHVERTPSGTFDIHSADPGAAPLNASSHNEIESHFAEKLISFVGRHLPPETSDALRAQLASGNIKVFINKTSGFTVTTNQSGAGSIDPALPSFSDAQFSGASNAAPSGPIISSDITQTATFGSDGTPIDSAPITPGKSRGLNFFRLLLALMIIGLMMYVFLHRH
jgi:hypothetical protein